MVALVALVALAALVALVVVVVVGSKKSLRRTCCVALAEVKLLGRVGSASFPSHRERRFSLLLPGEGKGDVGCMVFLPSGLPKRGFM